MAITRHIEALRRRHEDLDARLKQMEMSPSADHLETVHLKREKLRVKDEIERLQRPLNGHAIARQ